MRTRQALIEATNRESVGFLSLEVLLDVRDLLTKPIERVVETKVSPVKEKKSK